MVGILTVTKDGESFFVLRFLAGFFLDTQCGDSGTETFPILGDVCYYFIYVCQ